MKKSLNLVLVFMFAFRPAAENVNITKILQYTCLWIRFKDLLQSAVSTGTGAAFFSSGDLHPAAWSSSRDSHPAASATLCF